MNNMNWLLRAVRWARNPPSERHVLIVLIAVALALAIAGLGYLGLWPEWAQLEHGRGMRLPR